MPDEHSDVQTASDDAAIEQNNDHAFARPFEIEVVNAKALPVPQLLAAAALELSSIRPEPVCFALQPRPRAKSPPGFKATPNLRAPPSMA
jgi:hypothetical protein